ncbi:MAG: ribonuclease E activity regulator RraA [Woeseiaceae bacterium]
MNELSTPDLSDQASAELQVLAPILRNFGALTSFGGQAVTIKCFEDNSLVKAQGQVDGDRKVLVVDGGGSPRRALLGDQIALALAEHHWAGIVIYGYVRDVDALATTQLGIQAMGAIPVKTEKKGIGELNVPVTFGGVTIQPGDWIYADNNGLLVSPTALT